MRSHLALLLVGVLLISAAGGDEKKPAPGLTIRSYALREVKEKGPDGKEQTKYVQIKEQKSGDEVSFLIQYRNETKEPISEGQIVYQVPPGAVFMDAWGEGAMALVSIDKGEHWARHPATIKVKGKDGKVVEKPLPLDRITHVRWIIQQPVKPGAEGQVGLKVKIK